MRNSIIFFKGSSAKTAKYTFVSYDCCESLGSGFYDRNHGNVMYVGVPKKEMDEFFLKDNYKNTNRYLELITKAFDINYSIASKEDLDNLSLAGCGFVAEDMVTVRIEYNKIETISNKYFNVAYNAMRYLWYNQYTNMAIIATNLYNLEIIEDPIDVLAIAFSYQGATDRAILPCPTIDLEGLLFFRPKAENIADLQKNTPFNTVFYRYPIFFNPIVKVRGSFFEDSESIIEAKDLFAKFVGLEDIADIPKFMVNNIRLVYDDYLLMKSTYLKIKGHLDNLKYSMNKNSPLLLSKDLTTININAVDAMGYNKKVQINVIPETNKSPFSTDDLIDMKKENHKKMEKELINDVDFEETSRPLF